MCEETAIPHGGFLLAARLTQPRPLRERLPRRSEAEVGAAGRGGDFRPLLGERGRGGSRCLGVSDTG